MENTEFLAPIYSLCAEYHMLPAGETVLCALSGGADSMALLHLLKDMSASLRFTLWAAHYNHKLRGAESQRDEDFVIDTCRALEIPLILGEGDVELAAKSQGLGIEETARNLRYAFLEDAARQAGAMRIATAHHADDNMETMLLHLIRGAGLRGLSGIQPVRGPIIRPLLYTSRQAIMDYVGAMGIPFVEDSSNGDTRFARNRLRHDVLPILRELNPQIAQAAAAASRSLREDLSYLEARGMELFRQANPAEDGMVIPNGAIAMSPRAVSKRALLRILEEIEAPAPGHVHLNGILAIAQGSDPSAALHLPGGVLVQRVYNDLLIAWDYQNEPLPPLEPAPLNLEGVTLVTGTNWESRCERAICPTVAEEGVFYLQAQGITGQILLRARQTGDQIALPGRSRKTIKKLMIEEKVPRRIRERIPVLADDLGVLALGGFGPHRDRLASPGQEALAIRLWEKP